MEPAVLTGERNRSAIGAAGSVAALLRWHAAEHPDRPFLVFEDSARRVQRLCYGTVWERARATAAALRGRGATSESRVLVALPNCLEFCDLWFATALLGAVLVPVNPSSSADEIAWVLTDARCALAVGDAGTAERIEQAASTSGLAVPVLVTGVDVTPGEGSPDVDDVVVDGEQHRDVTGETLAAVLYTSGTTSRPKGVMVTHANYLSAGDAVAGHLRMRPDDRWLVVLPLFHANAQYYCVMSALVTGASVAIAARFTASGWARQCRELGATLASLFAAPLRMILAAPASEADADNDLRATLFAQNLTYEQAAEFGARFATPLLQLYGMTETIAPATCNPLYGVHRADSIGRGLLGRRLGVVDASGNGVACGEVGELVVHGEPGRDLAVGYLNNRAATDEAIRDGCLRTGDLVRAGEDGYLYFVDRAKDMIKRSGENVAASEVERVVNAHPGVFESAAVGEPDPVRDEAIVVHVVRDQESVVTEAELLAWCEQRLAPFKVPSHVRFTDRLPRTSVGKIRKDALRERADEPEGARR